MPALESEIHPHRMKTLLTLGLSLFAAATIAAEAPWIDDFAAALTNAKDKSVPVLMNFTGSDWCSWCKKMKREALDKKEFTEWAASNVILMEVDSPDSKPQAAEVKKQNEALKQRFKVSGYPTFVLVDAEGKELGRVEGYTSGGPAAFIKLIESWRKTK
jgi:protein disulfide-isomerase